MLLLFLTGRGHNAFRQWVLQANEAGWSRVELRFMLEALYQRLGVLIRNDHPVDDLLRFRRVLQEILAQCSDASGEIRTRISTISEFVTDLINQDSGQFNDALLTDPSCLKLLETLESRDKASEAELVAIIGNPQLFNRVMCNLHVARLVSLRTAQDTWYWELTARGKRRMNAKNAPSLLEELDFYAEDILIFTPIRPLFDMLILPFAQAVRYDTDRYRTGSAGKLAKYGVEVRCEPIEQPLDSWLSLDEVYLQSRSRSAADIPAVIGPGKRESRFFRESVLDISTGNAFVGFHLLVCDDALQGRTGMRGLTGVRGRTNAQERQRSFPTSADEILSLVQWKNFGSWLVENDLKAEIIADSGTRPLIEALLPCAQVPEGHVTFEDIESNTKRLYKLNLIETGLIRLAAATGPLMAMARAAKLSILVSSWDMLDAARQKNCDFSFLGGLLLKQTVHIAISKHSIIDRAHNTQTADLEDRIFRIFAFLEAAYEIVVKEPEIFAKYCSDQWSKLCEQFPQFEEFHFKLSEQDIQFAVDSCYRWLGHDLASLQPAGEWPSTDTSLRTFAFWTQHDADICFWPKILERRREVRARIDGLLEEAKALASNLHESEKRALGQRVDQLCDIGQLRKAEAGLMYAIAVLREEGSSSGFTDTSDTLLAGGKGV